MNLQVFVIRPSLDVLFYGTVVISIWRREKDGKTSLLATLAIACTFCKADNGSYDVQSFGMSRSPISHAGSSSCILAQDSMVFTNGVS